MTEKRIGFRDKCELFTQKKDFWNDGKYEITKIYKVKIGVFVGSCLWFYSWWVITTPLIQVDVYLGSGICSLLLVGWAYYYSKVLSLIKVIFHMSNREIKYKEDRYDRNLERAKRIYRIRKIRKQVNTT